MAEARSHEYESDDFSETSSVDKSSEDSDAEYDHQKMSGIDLEEIEKYFRVDLMYNENGRDWPRTTYLYYELELINQTKSSKGYKSKKDNKREDRIFNLNKKGVKKHAEEILLEFLQEELISKQLSGVSVSSDTSYKSKKDKKMEMKLEMLTNYSPCKNCADLIKQFHKTFENKYKIDLRITFGTFYKFDPINDKNENVKGLTKLLKAGIKLRLVWDSKSLKATIKQIGSEEDRKKREQIDRDYMKRVEERLN